MHRLWSFIVVGVLPVGSLILHAVIFLCYARRWDKVTGLTVFPFWAWGIAGIGVAGFAWLMTRRRFPLAVVGIWVVTVLFYSDETRPVLRSLQPRPEMGKPAPAADGSPVRRVITFNCRAGYYNRAAPREVIPWEPDVVLLQETSPRVVLEEVAKELYGGSPAEHVVAGAQCGIITRGRIVWSNSGKWPNAVLAVIQFADGSILQVASVHLRGAETDVRLYKREALLKHARNRQARRAELRQILAAPQLADREFPSLVGGDFNAPAGDAIFRLLESAGFTDAMAEAGSGWPDTYPNEAPLLRIDYQWFGDRLRPVRGRTVKSVHSDHRMVVVDYVVEQG